MRSVADDLSESDLRELAKLSAEERIELALRLGRRDLEFYIATNNVDRDTALRALRRSSQAGRRYSRCSDES